MSLPSTYADRNCSLARALEIVGERWTLLIVRDSFYGVRRFGDFATQLGIPRAVLTNRLKLLVHEGVLTRDDSAGTVDYVLTDKGVALWPIVRSLINWGDEFYSPAGAKRTLRHDADGALLDHEGRCEKCGELVAAGDVRIEPGPGFRPSDTEPDPVSAALNVPRRLLDPISTAR
ncbi:helix-turn-helix domain-containing protein [Amycolatopsis rhabdoformis]|uniref:Helix-turn-helix domain-containing protein n=1 Tax=Amycolatopsis rhabdoformis TaxID=1448059 RepID=A0ABZ1HV49_9PSEU|nr:helix-turn-helix domain-containing protein [Amycolatopsis rhabdoformis]WSE26204.1 helix-turn-helix domain-containing protein [Amycolatopsis rhabdoformis]